MLSVKRVVDNTLDLHMLLWGVIALDSALVDRAKRREERRGEEKGREGKGGRVKGCNDSRVGEGVTVSHTSKQASHPPARSNRSKHTTTQINYHSVS